MRPPLTEGEKTLLKFLDNELPESWSLYAQPYVNDMRPDVVALNPYVGLVVFEVKDWSIGRYSFENSRLVARTATECWIEDDPLVKSRWYAENLYRQFFVCDEAELAVGFKPNNRLLFRNAVYFHKAKAQQVLTLYEDRKGKQDILLGSDSLTKEKLKEIVPFYFMERSRIIRARQIEVLKAARSWLVPPQSALEQQRPLPELTTEQRFYAKPGQGFRRIRGVAGSGKSLVLAHRAAASNQEGRNILVLSFNITMSHVLHDLLKRARGGVDWHRVTWGHFHGWGKTQAVNAGFELSELPERENDAASYEAALLDAFEKIVDGKGLARSYEIPKYDGIYVDEAQDFEPQWLDALAAFLTPEGELVIVADHRQNLYGKDGGKDSARSMKRCRFSGSWAQMPRKTWRLPWRVAMALNEFAAAVSLGDEEDLNLQDYAERPRQADLPVDVIAWKPVESTDRALDSIEEAMAALGDPHLNDVVVLVPNHQIGAEAVRSLSPRFHQIVHVFGRDKAESRRRKVAFWMGSGGLKMCTIHSFKGWEINNVILVWPPGTEMERVPKIQEHSLFYTALSRALANIVVLNANREYDRFFAAWDHLTPQSASPE